MKNERRSQPLRSTIVDLGEAGIGNKFLFFYSKNKNRGDHQRWSFFSKEKNFKKENERYLFNLLVEEMELLTFEFICLKQMNSKVAISTDLHEYFVRVETVKFQK